MNHNNSDEVKICPILLAGLMSDWDNIDNMGPEGMYEFAACLGEKCAQYEECQHSEGRMVYAGRKR